MPKNSLNAFCQIEPITIQLIPADCMDEPRNRSPLDEVALNLRERMQRAAQAPGPALFSRDWSFAGSGIPGMAYIGKETK